MKTLMIISTEHSGLYYSLFYMLAFIIAGVFFIYHGFRKGYPQKTWLMVTLIGVFFFILGNKIFTASPDEWKIFLEDFRLPDTGKRSVLGGILGLVIGLFVAKGIFRFRFPLFNHLAYALPVAIAVTRLGCLKAGCCFGTPTDLPWAVQYGTSSNPFMVHLHHDLIHAHASASLPVHPTQLYDIFFCLLTVVLLWITAKKWKASGSMFLFSVICHVFFRFIEEFFRDASAAAYFGEITWGLKNLQWILLAAVLLMVSVLLIRERKIKTTALFNSEYRPCFLREVTALVIVISVLIMNSNWFDIFESTTIIFFMIPAAMAVSYHLYCRLTIPSMRWSLPVIFIAGLLFMGQSPAPYKSKKGNYTEVRIGTMFGNYYKNAKMVLGQDFDCWGYPYYIYGPEAPHQYNFYTAGADITWNLSEGEYKRFRPGFGVFIGEENEKRLSGDYREKHNIFGINSHVNIDWQYFGIGLGASMGELRSALLKKIEVGEYYNATRDISFIPQLSIRVGPYDIFYFESSFADHFPSCSPLPSMKVGIGTGLDKTDGTKIGIGAMDFGSDFFGYYGQVIFPVNEQYYIEAFYGDNFKTKTEQGRVASIGLNIRFGEKRKSSIRRR